MKLVEELLPFLILVAITLAGKYFEARKNRAKEVQNQPDESRQFESETETESEVEAEPEPEIRRERGVPPVADIPEPLRNLMKAFHLEPKPIVAPIVQVPDVVKETPRRRVEVHTEKPQSVAPVSFQVTPEAVRNGMLWKAVLDEPRFKRPWRPVQ